MKHYGQSTPPPGCGREGRSIAPARLLATVLAGAAAVGALAQAPSVDTINDYLIIGMRPSSNGEAVTIGSSQEIGADRQTLTGGTPSGNPDSNKISPVTPTIVNSGPSDQTSPNLRDVYFPDPSNPLDPSKNRWFWDNAADAHFLPGPDYPGDTTSKLFLFRGVDWSGDVAVTSASGRFSLQNINVFGQFGFKARNQSAPANVSNSRYFDAQSGSPLTGVSMDSLDDSSPRPDSAAQGWDGGVDLDPLLADLRLWRTFIRGLSRDTFFASGDGSNPRDLVNRNTINAGGSYTGSNTRFLYDVDGLDSNNDGYAVIDIAYDGTDFEVNNSDWIIYDSNPGNGSPFVIFRIRGKANMNMSNASIMVGEGLACDSNGLGVIFAKAHPDEEFDSTSGSSDAVFNANNLVLNRVGLWDLNTIGDANLDTDYGAPSDSSVYLSGSGGKPNTDSVNRGSQGNYTTLGCNNGQGCGQFISPFVYFQNVRWIKCAQCDAPTEASLGSTVFADANNNGFQDVGELGIAGVTVQVYLDDGDSVYDAGDTLAGTDTTDVNGDYYVSGLDFGNYFVVIPAANFTGGGALVTQPISSTPTDTADNQEDGDDNGIQAGGSGTQTVSPMITLSDGGEPTGNGTTGTENKQGGAQDDALDDDGDMTVDFGFFSYASIGNYVWVDTDADGTQNEVGTGYDGATVNLYQGDGTFVSSETTSGGGFYLFDGLVPGDYYVVVEPPVGYVFSPQNQGGDDALDSDVNGAGRMATTTLVSGENDLTWDAGLIAPGAIASITGSVYDDLTAIPDQNKNVPIPNVPIKLYIDTDADGFPDDYNAPYRSTTTDSNGYYEFLDVPIGASYVIIEEDLPGYISTYDVFTTFGDNRIALEVPDPGVYPLNDFWDYIPGTSGDIATSLGSLVWLDLNDDGLYTAATESGIDGVNLLLWQVVGGVRQDADGNAGNGLTPFRGTTTAGGGLYFFGNLPPGDYQVEVPASNFAAGGALSGATRTSGTPDPNDNQEDDDNNGSQAGGAGTVIYSPVITLADNAEPADGAAPGPNTEFGPGALQDNTDDNNGDMTVDFGLRPNPPTAAELAFFRATQGEGGTVRLSWGTLVEADLLGFRLERSGGGGQWTPVVDGLIPAEGGNHQPRAYRFEDAQAEGATQYRLMAVDLRGRAKVAAEAAVRAGLVLRADISEGTLRVTLRGEPNGRGVVESAVDPVVGPWEPVGTINLDAAGEAVLSRPVETAAPMRFFRVSE